MAKVLKIVGAVVAIAGLAIVTGGAALGLGLTLSTTAFGVSAGALLAAGAVINAAGSLLAPKPKAPDVSGNNADRLTASIDLRAARKIIFGTTAMATDIRDQEFTDTQTYLHRWVVVASHKVNAISQIWFDDKMAWSASGGVTSDFTGYLTVTPILEGSAANSINISARMGSTRRYTGCAYVYLRYKLTGNTKKTASPFAQSIPSRMTIIGNGALMYDPRLDSTRGGSGSHRANDQTTWAWDADASRNPALCLLWYLLGWRIQNPVTSAYKLAVGKGIPPARIDFDSFITAANLCDESVGRSAGGTEPRYRCDGIFGENDDPALVLENLKACMNAVLDDVDGKLRLTVLHNDLASPIGNLTTDDVLGEFRWDQTPPLSDTFNVIRGGYTDASTTSLYQLVDGPEQSFTSPDGIDRIETINLPLVQSSSQRARLLKQRLQRMLYSGTFSAEFQATAWKFQKGDVIRLTFAPLGFDAKLFRIADMAIRVDGVVPMVLREEHADIYQWDDDDAAAVVGAEPTRYDPLLSAVAQGFDDAAMWDNLTGAAKPEDNATRNDDGANMLTSPLRLDQAELLNGAIFEGDPDAPSVQLFTTNALVRWCPPVECRPNDELFLDYDLRSDGAGAETCNASYIYFDAAGATLGAVNLSDRTETTLNAVSGINATIRCRFTTPSTAFLIQPYLERPVATGQSFFARLPYLGRAERGSTKGAILGVNVVDPTTGLIPTRDELIPGQVLLDRGIEDGATVGASAGTNLDDGIGGVLSRFDIVTSLGESDSYAGQALTEQKIFAANQNRLFNSEFKYGLTGWTGDAFVPYNDITGSFVSPPLGVGGVKVLTSTRPITCAPSAPCTLSATFRGDASVNQFLFVDVEWRNGNNNALISYSSGVTNGVFWQDIATTGDRKSQTFNSPNATDGSTFVKAYLRIVTLSDVGVAYGELLVTKIQFENGSIETLYNPAADDGAVLSNVTGQLPDGRNLNASNTFGLRALAAPGALGDTVISGQLYLTIGEGTYYGDWGGLVTYPANGALGPGPFGLTYHIWRIVSGPGDPGSGYSASPTLTNALGVGKVYLGSVVARASAGDPPGTSNQPGTPIDEGGGLVLPG